METSGAASHRELPRGKGDHARGGEAACGAGERARDPGYAAGLLSRTYKGSIKINSEKLSNLIEK